VFWRNEARKTMPHAVTPHRGQKGRLKQKGGELKHETGQYPSQGQRLKRKFAKKCKKGTLIGKRIARLNKKRPVIGAEGGKSKNSRGRKGVLPSLGTLP